jgi:bacillithiol system protein YtxJ
VTLKDRVRFLTTPDEVDAFLKANPASVIFKAGTCHKTPETFVHLEKRLEGRDDLLLGILRVVEARAASNHVARLTGITHESPQFILFKDGKAVFDRDNWDITDEALAHALETHLARVQESASFL